MIRYKYNSGGKLIVGHPSSHSEDPVLREAAFKVYNGPNDESEELLDNLLESRHKLALTCGFPSYAHRLKLRSYVQILMINVYIFCFVLKSPEEQYSRKS